MKANLRSSLIASSILSIMMLTSVSNAQAVSPNGDSATPAVKTTEVKTNSLKKNKKSSKSGKASAVRSSRKVDTSSAAGSLVGPYVTSNSKKAGAAEVAVALKPEAKAAAEVTPVDKKGRPSFGSLKEQGFNKGEETPVAKTVEAAKPAPVVKDMPAKTEPSRAVAPTAVASTAPAAKPAPIVVTTPIAPKAEAKVAAKPIDTKTLATNLLKPTPSEEAAKAKELAEIKKLKETSDSKSTRTQAKGKGGAVHIAEAPKTSKKRTGRTARKNRPTLKSFAGVKTLKGPRSHRKIARSGKAVRSDKKVVKAAPRRNITVRPAIKIARHNETRLETPRQRRLEERRIEARRERRLEQRREEKLAQTQVRVPAPVMDSAAITHAACAKAQNPVECMKSQIDGATRDIDTQETRLLNCGELRAKQRGDERVLGMVSNTLIRLHAEQEADLQGHLSLNAHASAVEKREISLRSMLKHESIVRRFANDVCDENRFERAFGKSFETTGNVQLPAIQSYNPEQVYVRSSRRAAN